MVQVMSKHWYWGGWESLLRPEKSCVKQRLAWE